MRRTNLGTLAAVVALAGCGGGDSDELRSRALRVEGRTHLTVDPGPPRRPLLVLLHGRGMEPEHLLWRELYDALERLGEHAPALLLVDGGEHSYYHDRRDFPWGSHTLRAVRAAERNLKTNGRVAIGGISMGGFGAYDLARQRDFCAVGGHSPALFRSGGETPADAFDDAEDFERHDVLGAAAPASASEARASGSTSGATTRSHGTTVQPSRLTGARTRVGPGGHDTRYWRAHVDEYVRFYVDALADC